MRRGRVLAIVGVGAAILVTLATLGGPARVQSARETERVTESDESERERPESSAPPARKVSRAERDDALARAQVWRDPAAAVSRVSFSPLAGPSRPTDCQFKITELGGTTPKFHCLLSSNLEVRVKYGPGGEIPAESAATRLLSALGFGADRIALVEQLRCFGCPREPFTTMKVLEAARARNVYEKVMNPEKYQTFEWVALEHKFDAAAIETDDDEGWAFFELKRVDPAKGGAPRTHIDALRLMAVFLAHWDNKAENQRLVCLTKPWPEGTPCREPFLLLQDVGSTFGPHRLDLDEWARAAIWEDRASCKVSMREFPYEGGTFGSAIITEPGRQFLGRRLAALDDRQLTDLFSTARFDQPRSPLTRPRPVSEWVRVFRDRVKTITDGPPCPAR